MLVIVTDYWALVQQIIISSTGCSAFEIEKEDRLNKRAPMHMLVCVYLIKEDATIRIPRDLYSQLGFSQNKPISLSC